MSGRVVDGINDEIGDIAAVREALAAFRSAQIHTMTLPDSGLVVKLKKTNLMDLVAQGVEIPDSLSGLFEQSMNGEEIGVGIAEIGGMSEMFDMIVIASVVSPPVVRGHGDEDHLGTYELPLADKKAIFNYGNGEARALTTFREEQRELDLVALAGQDIQQAAV